MSVRGALQPYAVAYNGYAVFTTVVAVTGYTLTLSASVFFLNESLWWAYVASTVLGSLLMVKVFTIQHDCGHDSMFSSATANLWVGRVCSLLTTMPFDAWKQNHAAHHGALGNLSKTGIGDTALMTVEEFKSATPSNKLVYRITRNPLVHLVFSPFFYFFILFKILHVFGKEHRISTLLNDFFVLSVFLILAYFFGFWALVVAYVPTLYFGGIVGLLLFYLQHNFPGMHWYKPDAWEHERASLNASSLIVMPQPLEWFTHAIGYHHVHHLNSKIPGYRLKAAYKNVEALHAQKPLTLRDAVYSFRLKLWSFDQNRLVTYAEAESLAR